MLFQRIGAQSKSASQSSRHVQLRLEQLEERCVPSATDLGVAGEFNVFVFQDFNGTYCDVEGRLAAGRDISLSNYSVGDKLGDSNGTRDDLIAGDDITFRSGQVFSGNVVYGDTSNLRRVGVPNGTVRQGNVLDFTAAQTELTNKSAAWAEFDTTGTIVNKWGELRLTGTDPAFNVFNITAEQLDCAWGIKIKAPAGSTVLVNVSGTHVTMDYMDMQLRGVDRSQVLFNLHEADCVTMAGIGFQGSILAPKAQVNFNDGNLWGSLVAKSFCGGGQFNHDPICINIPDNTEQPISLSGKVFNDKNADGIQQANEPGVQDVTLVLAGQGNSVFLTTQTNANGEFVFTDLPAGQFTTAIVIPEGFTLVTINVGSEGGNKSLLTGEITDIPLEEGDFGINYEFGIRVPDGGGVE